MKSKNLLGGSFLSLALCAFVPATVTAGSAGVSLTPMQEKMAFVSLDSLDAEFYSASKVVSIKGSIKNISNSTLRGFVTIYLIAQNGVVLSASDMPVNDHHPFMDGESVAFETVVNVSNSSGASRVSVEFTKD